MRPREFARRHHRAVDLQFLRRERHLLDRRAEFDAAACLGFRIEILGVKFQREFYGVL
jgi:hypothetical protein